MIGVTFTMARNPEEFTKVPGTNLSIARTDAYPDAPALRIFFTYNPYEAHLLFVEFAEEPDNFMNERSVTLKNSLTQLSDPTCLPALSVPHPALRW
jgi:hypothetical protein